MKAAGIFSDNMILLRDKEVCVFGTGENQEKIQVEIDGLKAETEVENGEWQVMLPPHCAGGPFEMKITGTGDELVISNVMYGEVWFAGGQSNMELEVQNAEGGEKELAEADYADIRHYNVIKAPVVDDEMLAEEASRHWHSCQNGDFREMSAVAYFFAVKTYEQLKVPIGIVDCYQGGTSITCWLSEENVRSLPEGKPYVEEYEKVIANQTEEEYDQA
ncbi:MAG: sialate O-acetylesterase, partial [Lachnospiraceae bacterium]|nr:sialate O-acetylesterase [Lachnospiraceae bacterium]